MTAFLFADGPVYNTPLEIEFIKDMEADGKHVIHDYKAKGTTHQRL
jgi:hypothetical protein